MKTVNIRLPKELKGVEIHTFSDWHIGDKFCDKKSISDQIEYIKNTKNAYVICNGDLMNNATKTSVSDCYAEALTPMEQLQTLISLLEPIKDKILMLTQGNHEARTYKTDGIDLTALVAAQLGIQDRYVREGGVLFLRFGCEKIHNRPMLYTFYASHGSGGGKRPGGKINRLEELANIVDTDIYICGHTHLPVVMKENFYRLDNKNSCVAEVTKLFVNSSAKLGYGGYGQTYGFTPSNTTSPVIFLNGTKKDFTARL